MQQGQAPILIIVGILAVVLIAGGAYYLGRSTSTKSSPTPTITSPIPQPTSIPSPTPDETANWKTYTHGNLTFKYPPDWIAKDFEYANSVIIENIKSTVKITISEGQYPYGLTGYTEVKENPLNVVVNGKEYKTIETIIGGSNAYVDLELDTPQKHHILFGTGYPADDDLNISLEDYSSSKDTILKIFSSFKFL